jgi:ribose transport system ATP-binding protein
VLSVRKLSKTFADRTVLASVDLDIRQGEVHALLGQNGSGKSTLIKILSGYHAPDPGGTVFLNGEEVRLPIKPSDTVSLGISFVHQDLGLFESGTVLENLRIGTYETGAAWRVRWRAERVHTRRLLDKFGLDLAPDALIAELSQVERAMLALVRAIDRLEGHEHALLVLDEPTSYLPKDSTERLFKAVRDVAAAGFGVLFVTHRLEEVPALCDNLSVLRDGRLMHTGPADATQDELVRHIVGFAIDDLYPDPHPTPAHSERLLDVNGVVCDGLQPVSFQVRPGEIVGLTGLLGMGYELLPPLLFGAEKAHGGALRIAGAEVDLTKHSPRKAMQAGLAFIPANRLRDGAVATASVGENITLATLGTHFSGGRLRASAERRVASEQMVEFDVQPRDIIRPLGEFSGGNQQKALLAKWFIRKPRVLLLQEPTQGVDIGARRQIFAKIADLARNGTGIIIASAEYEDLAHMCDRVLVFRHGAIRSELHGETLTPEHLVERCFRHDA